MHFVWSCASIMLLSIAVVHKFLAHGHCSESGLHSLPSKSSRCPWLVQYPYVYSLNRRVEFLDQTCCAKFDGLWIRFGRNCLLIGSLLVCPLGHSLESIWQPSLIWMNHWNFPFWHNFPLLIFVYILDTRLKSFYPARWCWTGLSWRAERHL